MGGPYWFKTGMEPFGQLRFGPFAKWVGLVTDYSSCIYELVHNSL